MPTPPPETHPTWAELIASCGLVSVLIPKVIDWLRVNLLLRRKDDATVAVAHIESDSEFRAQLMARVAQVESQNTALVMEVASLKAGHEQILKRIAFLIDRFEGLVGTSVEIAELQSAMRQMIYELQSILGRDSPVVTGPRSLGEPALSRGALGAQQKE